MPKITYTEKRFTAKTDEIIDSAEGIYVLAEADTKANAHLIASAPDYDDLLRHPLGTSHVASDPNMIWIRLDETKYRQALAKAEGKDV